MKTIEDIKLEAAISEKVIALTRDVVENLGSYTDTDITDMAEAVAMNIINLVQAAA